MPTTSPDGLIYPDSSGNTNIWEHIQNLATSTQTALTAVGAQTWSSWTPTWLTASEGGFTSVGGSGQNQGFYTQIGDLVHAEFRIELAAGFAVVAGTWTLTLPVPAYVWGGTGNQASVGSWIARDDGGPVHYAGTLGIHAIAGTHVNFAGPSTGTGRVTNTIPFTWANNDVLSGKLDYRAA